MSGRSSCPECGTILRIRDRSFVGRRVSCPECNRALRIASEDEHGDFVARCLTPDELASGERGLDGVNMAQNKILLPDPSSRSFIGRIVDSPLTAAWLLAIAISSLIAVLALAPKYRFAAARPVPATNEPESLVEAPNDAVPKQKDQVEQLSNGASVSPPTAESVDGDRTIKSISALEPANVDGPIPNPPDAVVTEVIPEPPALAPLPPPKVDVESKLKQKLVLYKQAKPVSRRELIEALQEQLGAPIRYDDDELGAVDLDKTVTFELENTTVGGVIKTVTDAAGWQVNIEGTGLRLTRK